MGSSVSLWLCLDLVIILLQVIILYVPLWVELLVSYFQRVYICFCVCIGCMTEHQCIKDQLSKENIFFLKSHYKVARKRYEGKQEDRVSCPKREFSANWESWNLCHFPQINTSYLPSVRSVRQVMDRVFSYLLWPKREAHRPWKQGRKKRGSITCHTDRANEANKMFIIWLCWLFRFWKGDRDLEVHTATYGPGIDQSQYVKSVSHIIITNMNHKYIQDTLEFFC